MKNDSNNIVKGVIAHKKIVYFTVAVLVALGVAGLSYMNKDEFPSFELKNGLIVGVYPGADASEVEDVFLLIFYTYLFLHHKLFVSLLKIVLLYVLVFCLYQKFQQRIYHSRQIGMYHKHKSLQVLKILFLP